MKFNYKNLIVVIALAALQLYFAPLSVYALSLASPSDLILDVSPVSPQAGSNFIVSAKSYTFEAVRAKFTWYLNGKEITTGTGATEENFIASSLGSNMNIRVTATPGDGGFYQASVSVAISNIDFIIHAQTYTPALYRGSALPTPKSVVQIFAIPHLYSGGIRLNPQNLIYEWSLDDKPVLNQSGGGQNNLSLLLADIKNSEHTITLRVSSSSNSIFVEKNTTLRTYDPEILFYRSNSVIGKSRLASSMFAANPGSAFSIIAEPYFIALDSLAKAKYSWTANGAEFAKDTTNPRILDLTAPQDAASQTNFSLSITDPGALFQRISGSLNVLIAQ